MKILQLITELHPAGAERIVANLSLGLKDKGYDITVVSLQPLPKNRTIVDELENHHIPVESLNVTKFTPLRIFRLCKLIKKLKLDIVHAHLFHANITSRITSIFIPKNYKIINTIHISEKRKSKWWHFVVDKLTYQLCDQQTAVSDAAKNHYSHKTGIAPEKISVIHNGINPPKKLNKNDITKLRKEWGFEDCSKVIGSVGRLDWQKGYDILFKILPCLSTKIPDGKTWGVIILGEGPKRQELEALAKKIPANIKVILPGYRKDAAEGIGAFDLFVMPSRYEGFGLTLIEAMAHGIPILSSNVDSLPEILNNYKNGLTIEFADINQEKIIENILKMINAGFIDAEFNYSIEKMVNNYISLYSQII